MSIIYILKCFEDLVCCVIQDSMVICRLRKNSEFHLNDTPRNQRNQLVATDSATAMSGAGQLGSLELVEVADCCSKEGSSSFHSLSVEQIDSGSDSEKPTKEFSQHNSSGHFKVLVLSPSSVAHL